MTKLNHHGPEQKKHNKVVNNYVKKAKILTSILGFACKAAKLVLSGLLTTVKYFLS